MKRILCILLSVLSLLFSLPLAASANEMPSADTAKAVYLYHIDSDTLVYEKNSESAISAGSTPKILSGLIACERLSHRLTETVTITESMVDKKFNGYCLGITAGDMLTVEELLYAALCASYNDAYDILAHLIGGSMDGFVSIMNARAAELGATATLYTDASGIADNAVTTVRDLSKIASAALQNELYMSLTDTARYPFDGSFLLSPKTFTNRNELIAANTSTQYYNKKCHGMSAGYTDSGKSCVVTLAEENNDRYLCIVMGAVDPLDGKNYNHGYTVVNSFVNWVYQTYTYLEVLTPEQKICTIPVTVSDQTAELEIYPKETLRAFLPKNAEIGTDITYSVRLIHTSLEAPVESDTHVGYVAVLYQGKNIGTLPIYTVSEAERSPFVGSLKRFQAWTQSRVFVAGAVFFVIAFSAWILTEWILHRRRRHKWDKYFSTKMTPSADALKPKRPSDPERKNKP